MFLFQFVHIEVYTDRFLYVLASLHVWKKANWIVVDDLFNVFVDLICEYFIEYLCICVHKGNWPVILFFVVVESLCGLGTTVIVPY